MSLPGTQQSGRTVTPVFCKPIPTTFQVPTQHHAVTRIPSTKFLLRHCVSLRLLCDCQLVILNPCTSLTKSPLVLGQLPCRVSFSTKDRDRWAMSALKLEPIPSQQNIFTNQIGANSPGRVRLFSKPTTPILSFSRRVKSV